MIKRKYKPNRNSIVRIIISNYDNRGIKEVKVRYNKQAQLDTFLIDSQLENGIFTLKEVSWKAKEKYRYEVSIDKKADNSFEVIKRDKSLNKEVIRNYLIKFKVSSENKNVVVATIKDCIKREVNFKGERKNARRETSNTERKLLSKDTQLSYSKIACCSPEEIDSLKIYKIKRYLSYRSNMLIFFSLVNDVLCEDVRDENGEKIEEIWKIIDKADKVNEAIIDNRVSIIAGNLQKRFSEEIINYNNRIEKIIEKSKNSIENHSKKIEADEKNLAKSKCDKKTKKIEELKNKIKILNERIASNEKEKIKPLEYEEIKADIFKILEIYTELRHKLSHYDYLYFENLFENKNMDSQLEDLLDLNIFKYLTLSKKLRIENKTNYLDDKTKFSILGKYGSAKKYYSLYNTLCEQKNGFNTFINSFFVEDGIENREFKKEIDKRFKKEISFFENKKERKKSKFKQEEELNLLKEQQEEIGTAYIWDIHNLTKYKKIYNERKESVEKYNKTLIGNKDKNALRNCGDELLNQKIEMEKITKRNSIIRLKYKLQMAYSFIMEEFNGDISRFKNEFDIAKVEQIKEYRSKGKVYLNKIYDKDEFDIDEFQEQIGEIESSYEATWLDKNAENNLFKFYILTYILLPYEFKGDFLGFVKKHYYDIKNIEYLDESDEELTNEQLERMKNDSFFNKIRLFEKNSKKYNIFNKSFLTEDRVRRYFEKLNIKAKYYEYMGTDGEKRGIFNKNIVIPLFKYYQIILKLYNDVEIAVLLHLSKTNNTSIKEVIEKVIDTLKGKKEKEKVKYYKLNELLEYFALAIRDGDVKSINLKKSKKEARIKEARIQVRNNIQHLNYESLMEKIIELDTTLEPQEPGKNNCQPNINLREMLEYIDKYSKELNDVHLDFNFINDYYMRKEQFLFRQLGQVEGAITDPAKKKEKDSDKELMNICDLDPNNDSLLDDIKNINKLYKAHEELKAISEDETIKTYDDIKNTGVVNLENIKYKNKELRKIKDIAKLKEVLKEKSSLLFGFYKKKIIKLLKKKILEKLSYEEDKILYISAYEIKSKKKERYKVMIAREKSTQNFYIFDFENNTKKNQEISLPLGKVTELKIAPENPEERFKFSLTLNHNNEGFQALSNNVIDLRAHYCLYKEIKFKDLK